MLEDYAERYLSSLRRAAGTKAGYARDLGLFIAWAQEKGKADPREITTADIEEYLAGLVRKDGIAYAPATRNRALAAIKGYYKFLVKDRILTPHEDPASYVSTQKRPRRSPVFLELDEGARMVQVVRNRQVSTEQEAEAQVRDMAILTLLLGSGLRISELVTLNLDTWREVMQHGWLTVVGKGDKERVVPPSDEAIEHVLRYLSARPVVPPDRRGHPLFVSRKKTRLSAVQIERIVRSLAREAGIPKRITPHKLRATWVTQLLINGANPREVQAMAGHESLNTTMLYAGVRDSQALRDVVKRHQVRYTPKP